MRDGNPKSFKALVNNNKVLEVTMRDGNVTIISSSLSFFGF